MDVYKFGGSSLSSPYGFKKVLEIVRRKRKCVIVLSSIGKELSGQKKITDLLIELCHERNNATKSLSILIELKTRFFNIANVLKSPKQFYIRFLDFLTNYMIYDDNYIISRGEFFTCLLFSYYSKIPFVDSADLIKFKCDGNISLLSTAEIIKRVPYNKYITCGFYGSKENGEIVLFNRGGGDVSGAIIARVIKSKRYYKYTNVCGIYDKPMNLATKKTVKKMTYSALYKMSKSGMTAFSNEAIKYIAGKNITLIIANTFTPVGQKTIVSNRHVIISKYMSFRQNNILCIKIYNSEKHSNYKNISQILKRIMSDKIIMNDIIITKRSVIFYMDNYYLSRIIKYQKEFSGISIERTSVVNYIKTDGRTKKKLPLRTKGETFVYGEYKQS